MITPEWTSTTDTFAVAGLTIAVYRLLVSPATKALAQWAMPAATAGSPGPTGTGSAAAEGGEVTARTRLIAVASALAICSLAALGPTDPGPLKWLVATLLVILSWSFGATDFDLRRPERSQWAERALLLAAAAAALWWPVAILAWLTVICGRLRGWTHHAMMPIRLLKAYLAWSVAVPLLGMLTGVTAGARPGLFFVLATACLSHYLKPAWSKATLGPRWWSWAWENRTDFIIASAYNCGWARFLPQRFWAGVLRSMRPWVRPLNFATMLVEVSPLVAFTDRRVFVAVLAATIVFHTVVFLCAGILFWEGIVTNAGLAVAAIALPVRDTAPAFGTWAAAAAILIMVLAIVDLVWQPFHLGWWDNPFTTRVRWRVETVTGRIFHLGNDFMCPFEREFGRWTGLFFIPEPVLGSPGWGATEFDRDLRDQIRGAVGDLDALDRLKHSHGTLYRDERLAEGHVAFLTAMFARLNAGARKGPLPPRLRRLKPPGGQLSRWGDLPPYRGEEPVRRIIISCEERCYVEDVNEFVLLRERVLREVDIPFTAPLAAPPR